MGTCTGISALQLFATASMFLLAVLGLDVFWVKISEELHHGAIADALKKQSWLNAFVAFGALGASVLLFLWVSTCASAGL
jgi:hypothetical protein